MGLAVRIQTGDRFLVCSRLFYCKGTDQMQMEGDGEKRVWGKVWGAGKG